MCFRFHAFFFVLTSPREVTNSPRRAVGVFFFPPFRNVENMRRASIASPVSPVLGSPPSRRASLAADSAPGKRTAAVTRHNSIGDGAAMAHLAAGKTIPSTLPDYIARAAANGESRDVMQYLIDLHPMDRHERRDMYGRSLMHFAAAASRLTLLMEMQNVGFPFNTVDVVGVHPLHLAAISGNVDHISWMLDAGVSATIVDSLGRSVIGRALQSGQLGVVQLLRNRGAGEEVVAAALDEFKRRPFVTFSTDLHLLWEEAEAIVRLRQPTLLTRLPWDDMPHGGVGCDFFTGPVQQVAGMLLIAGEFQFNSATFAPGVSYNSPHTPGVRALVFQGLDVPFVVQVFSHDGRPLHLLRCYDCSGLEPEKQRVLTSVRMPDPEEKLRLAKLPRDCIQALLGRTLAELSYSAGMITRVFRWGRALTRFRRVLFTLMAAVGTAKRFMRTKVRTRKFLQLALRAHLAGFEAYAIQELVQIKSSSFPAMHRALLRATHNRDEIINTATMERKRKYLDAVRSGQRNARFSYVLTLEDICNVLVRRLDVKEIAMALHTKSSFLPRAMMVALARSAGSGAHEKIARDRFLTVLLELVSCYRLRTSYAEQFLRGVQINRTAVVEEASSGGGGPSGTAVSARSPSVWGSGSVKQPTVDATATAAAAAAATTPATTTVAPDGAAPVTRAAVVAWRNALGADGGQAPLPVTLPMESRSPATRRSTLRVTQPQLGEPQQEAHAGPVAATNPASKHEEAITVITASKPRSTSGELAVAPGSSLRGRGSLSMVLRFEEQAPPPSAAVLVEDTPPLWPLAPHPPGSAAESARQSTVMYDGGSERPPGSATSASASVAGGRIPVVVAPVLECDSRSPIPKLLGSRHALRQMLVVVSATGVPLTAQAGSALHERVSTPAAGRVRGGRGSPAAISEQAPSDAVDPSGGRVRLFFETP